jgi:hypothetical protein
MLEVSRIQSHQTLPGYGSKMGVRRGKAQGQNLRSNVTTDRKWESEGEKPKAKIFVVTLLRIENGSQKGKSPRPKSS